MPSLRSSRRYLWAAASLALVVGTATGARADEEAPPKKRRFVVTVEDNDAPQTPKKKTSAIPTPPEAGAPEAEVVEYIRALRRDVRTTQADFNAARASDDADEVLRLREELKEKKQFLSEEESRLYPKDTGLVAGGAILTALGSASLLSSLILLIGWPISGVDGDFDDELGWASLGCLGGGVLGLGAGIPMIVTGNKRTVRGADDVDDASRGPALPRGRTVGLTLEVRF